MRILDKQSHRFACEWIEACVVLYNILLNESDVDFYKIKNIHTLEEEEEIDLPDYQVNMRGEEKRGILFNYIMDNF